jgi:hypothetical protein
MFPATEAGARAEAQLQKISRENIAEFAALEGAKSLKYRRLIAKSMLRRTTEWG